jgi:UDP-N-acetylmuramoyl-L-alanyl-D-glutamate--2,6-diaminopimelate ligase
MNYRKKILSELIKNIGVISTEGDLEMPVYSICSDSRVTTLGSLFIAVKGIVSDGHSYIDDAIKSGAKAIVYEKEIKCKYKNITYIKVSDSRNALGLIAQNFFNDPSRKLKLIGVTGTNGKTTVATLLFEMFRDFGFNVALISTIENKINDEVFEATHTTPNPIELASFLCSAVMNDCTYAFMECSSQAIHQKRIEGLCFAGAVFTNLTHDHLDYHKNVDSYTDAKKELFDKLPTNAFALANHDDPQAEYILKDTKAPKYFFTLENTPNSDFVGIIKSKDFDGMNLLINKKSTRTNLIGKFNAYNMLAIYATANLLGIPKDKIVTSLSKLKPPRGRLQFFKSKSGVLGIVDYAHTPDALQNILSTIKENYPDNKIITVVGCSGNRDTTKRPIMGNIACKMSDYVVFSSDNPATENPESILEDIVRDLSKEINNYVCVAERSEAVSLACKKAGEGDIVLLAGKGHETYQIVGNKKILYSDEAELKKNLKILTN